MRKNKTAWYAVRALYRAETGGKQPSERGLLEERILLVRSTPDAAVTAARREAARREHSYKNVSGQHVTWRLQQILGISEVLDKAIKSGTEVYSQFHPNAVVPATIRRLGFRQGETVVRLG